MQRAWQRPLEAWVTALMCPSLTNQANSARSPSRKIESCLENFFSTILFSSPANSDAGSWRKISTEAKRPQLFFAFGDFAMVIISLLLDRLVECDYGAGAPAGTCRPIQAVGGYRWVW